MALERLSPDGTIKLVRADHVHRYQWASGRLRGFVVDAGCNCGYGSAILADAEFIENVCAVDNWEKGLAWGRYHWGRNNLQFRPVDLLTDADKLPTCDGVVAFEVIEHLANPVPFLEAVRSKTSRLLVSVPNEAVWAWEPRLAPVHHRHYRRDELDQLLISCGWTITEWFGQAGGTSPVKTGVSGRTLVVECH